jgi:ubiquinone/menaquinone biosynthesis C-methylase UbiE
VTDVLRRRVDRLTAIEIDPELARKLEARLRGSNVSVVEGDATAMEFQDESFSGAVSFTMLHHVPSPALQDRLLSEVCRVIRPGGLFVGSDSLTSRTFELVHLFDTLVPVDPDHFGGRLLRAGFSEVDVDTRARTMRFRAVRP